MGVVKKEYSIASNQVCATIEAEIFDCTSRIAKNAL
jgi:hypothetical protein